MEAGAGLVVVVGAGPAGATAAYILATKGRKVVLVDAPPKSSDRIEMLPPAAISAFTAAGLSYVLEDPSVTVPCLGIVRGPAARDRQDFIAQPGGRGLAADRRSLDAALKSAAISAGAEPRCSRLVAVETTGSGITLVIAGARGSARLLASTVIDATGRAGAVCRRLGAKMTMWQRLTAERTRWAEPVGPWLSFSADNNGWNYAIAGPAGRVDAWRVSPAPSSPFVGVSRVDASSRLLEPAAGARWIAIGDASTAFDPICCQGLAHAVSSAVVAAGVILEGGTVRAPAAIAYDAACRETAVRTEEGRRGIYASMHLRQETDSPQGTRQMLANERLPLTPERGPPHRHD